jgi:hypothetical protein
VSPGIKLSKMRKDELSDLLRSLGEEPHPQWTVPEIRSRIRELTEIEKEEDHPLKGMTSMRKDELVKLAEELKLVLNPSDTKGAIMRKLRLQVEMNTPPKPTDIVGFGRHANLEYVALATEVPSYLDWVIQTHKDGSLEPRLNRLARWGLEWKQEHKNTPKPKFEPRRGSPKRRATDVPESSNPTQGELLEVIQTLKDRIETLEKGADPKTSKEDIKPEKTKVK